MPVSNSRWHLGQGRGEIRKTADSVAAKRRLLSSSPLWPPFPLPQNGTVDSESRQSLGISQFPLLVAQSALDTPRTSGSNKDSSPVQAAPVEV